MFRFGTKDRPLFIPVITGTSFLTLSLIMAHSYDDYNELYEIPPKFKNDKCCKECKKTFGIITWRHHCRNCGNSFCDNHSKYKKKIYKYGYYNKVRVCDECYTKIE